MRPAIVTIRIFEIKTRYEVSLYSQARTHVRFASGVFRVDFPT